MSISGQLVIATPAATYPTSTVTTDPDEPPSESAATGGG